MGILIGMFFGFIAWFFVRYGLGGFYTVNQNERAVILSFGRAQRIGQLTTLQDPVSASLLPEEKERYKYPQLHVVGPGGPYFKFPWQEVRKVSVATVTVSIGFDPESPGANSGGQVLEAVTKDQLNTGLTGQLRYTVSERNLYACLFAVKNPMAHVMGYFVSILRQRIANFEAPPERAPGPADTDSALAGTAIAGISINDLRKNLRDLNEHMDLECASSAARYGIELNAALITGIDPPPEVDSALAAINTAHNHVSSEISLAQSAADQKIVQSRRAVEIETLGAQAEVEPLLALAAILKQLRESGPGVLSAYVRNARLALYQQTRRLVLTRRGSGVQS